MSEPTTEELAQWLEQRDRLTAERDRLREALNKYGRHMWHCEITPTTYGGEASVTPGKPCTCGLSAALATDPPAERAIRVCVHTDAICSTQADCNDKGCRYERTENTMSSKVAHATMVDSTLLPHTGELRYPVLDISGNTTVAAIVAWAHRIDPQATRHSITISVRAG